MAYLLSLHDDVTHKAVGLSLPFETWPSSLTGTEQRHLLHKALDKALDAVLRAESEE